IFFIKPSTVLPWQRITWHLCGESHKSLIISYLPSFHNKGKHKMPELTHLISAQRSDGVFLLETD
ncbi:MAG: hypothetical protein PVG37_09795, partial [Desulfobacterales bacterium]